MTSAKFGALRDYHQVIPFLIKILDKKNHLVYTFYDETIPNMLSFPQIFEAGFVTTRNS